MQEFLANKLGVSNAFTQEEKTVFFFESNNQGFKKAVSLFASMFEKPLFNSSFMDKEINAVNSEHEKNLNSDAWKKNQIVKLLSIPKGAVGYNEFSTGNNETLRNVTKEELNKELFDFFENNYYAENMRLVVNCKIYFVLSNNSKFTY